MFSRLLSQLNAFVGLKPICKLPSSISIGRRLHDQVIFGKTKADEGGYVFLAPTEHGQPRSGVAKGPNYLKRFIPPKVQIVDPLASLELQDHRSEKFLVSGNHNVEHIFDPTPVAL